MGVRVCVAGPKCGRDRVCRVGSGIRVPVHRCSSSVPWRNEGAFLVWVVVEVCVLGVVLNVKGEAVAVVVTIMLLSFGLDLDLDCYLLSPSASLVVLVIGGDERVLCLHPATAVGSYKVLILGLLIQAGKTPAAKASYRRS